jgi:hypothetical protein
MGASVTAMTSMATAFGAADITVAGPASNAVTGMASADLTARAHAALAAEAFTVVAVSRAAEATVVSEEDTGNRLLQSRGWLAGREMRPVFFCPYRVFEKRGFWSICCSRR